MTYLLKLLSSRTVLFAILLAWPLVMITLREVTTGALADK